MRYILLEGIFIFFSILAGRLIYTGLFKPTSKPGLAFSYITGGTVFLVFYVTWATTGLDPIQLTICTAFPEAPVCEEKRVQKDQLEGIKRSDQLVVKPLPQVPPTSEPHVQSAGVPTSQHIPINSKSPAADTTPPRQEPEEPPPSPKVKHFSN